MRAITIRFNELAYDFIAHEAVRTGAPFAEFVRGAALVRAALTFSARDPTNTAELLSLYETATAALERLGIGE